MPIVVTRRASSVETRQVFRAAQHVVSARQGDAPVLLDLRRGMCYSLNELGWRIWDQVGTGEAVATVVRTLRQEYGLPSDTFEADVTAFVDHLLKASLIEPVER